MRRGTRVINPRLAGQNIPRRNHWGSVPRRETRKINVFKGLEGRFSGFSTRRMPFQPDLRAFLEGFRLGLLTPRLCLSNGPIRRTMAADMPKSPENRPFSIVPPEPVGSPPPRPLGRHGQALWNAVMGEYGIKDTGGIELLAQACGAVDVIEMLGEAIARDGAIVYSRAGPKAHPAVKDQIAARAFVVRTLERLGLNVEAVKPGPGRPATSMGWTGQ
jgi:hypothetical protein